MSGTLTLTAGQIFTGGTSLSDGDTGMVAITSVGNVTFNTASSPPTITDVEITKDAAASSVSEDGIFIQSVTIDSVDTSSKVTLTTADLPPGITVPAGFTLPQDVDGTTIQVTVSTNIGTFEGEAGLYGTDGSLDLVAVTSLDVFGTTVNSGAAVLSLGTQPTGDVAENFTPAFTPLTPCFAEGTRLLTADGEVAVEALREGQSMVLASGASAPVKWLGHRRVDCRNEARGADIWPVRVRAGAFGPGLPRHDIRLSPDHAVFVASHKVLIPIRYLINGATIVQEPVDTVTYWHVELPDHDVLLAEGLPVESYLDTGNRDAFASDGGVVMAHPVFAGHVRQARSPDVS